MRPKSFFASLLVGCVLGCVSSFGATVFPPATQSEVDAGTVHSKFVAPDTLAGYLAGGGNPIFVARSNLSPYAATLYRTSLVVTNATNFTRVFNMFNASASTNLEADLATGGIRVTNNGFYELDLSVIYRQNTNQNGTGTIGATNIFAATTNTGSVGTNLTSVIGFSSTTKSNNFYYNIANSGLVYLPSNAVVGLGYYTIGASGTNDIAFERASLTVTLVPGSTFNNSTVSSGTVGTNVYTNTVYVNALGPTSLANGNLLTNTAYQLSAGSLMVVGPGTYWIGTNHQSLLPNMVDAYFMPGAKVYVGNTGTEQATDRYLFGDFVEAAPRTNRVYGFGEFSISNHIGRIVLMSSASSFFIEGLSAHSHTNVVFEQYAGILDVVMHKEIRAENYDGFVCVDLAGDLTVFCKTTASAPSLYAGNTLIEVGGSASTTNAPYQKPGDGYFKFGRMVTLAGPYPDGTGLSLCDNAVVDAGVIDFTARTGQQIVSTTNILVANLSTTPTVRGTIQNATILQSTNGTVPLINGNTDTQYGDTMLTLRNCTIRGSYRTNTIRVRYTKANTVLTLENCTIDAGDANYAIMANSAANILISGYLASDKGSSNITYNGYVITSTNQIGTLLVVDRLDQVSTNLIQALTEDEAGATNDFILTHDVSTALMKKMALGNIPVDWANLTGVPAGFADGTDDGGAGSAGGVWGMLQFNFNGSVGGATNAIWTNNTLSIGTGRHADSTLQVSNTSQASIFVDGVVSGALERMGVRPHYIGTEATTVTIPWSLGVQGTGVVALAHQTVSINADLEAKSFAVTNGIAVISSNLAVLGTNLVANGGVSSYFTNAIASSGPTNLVITNLVNHRTVTIDLWVTNGTTVTLCTAPEVAIPGAWYFDGGATGINSNGFSRIIISRYGGWTNVHILTPEMELQGNGNVVFVTNFATRVITATLAPVLTNLVGSTIGFPTGGVISNVSQLIWELGTVTVVGANSNQTVWLGLTNHVDMLVSTNVTFTNFNGIVAGKASQFTCYMKVTNSASNLGVNWGNLGGSNPGYGVAIWTNANAPMWTTLTNTKTYVFSVVSRGTNLHPTISLWE